MSATATSRRRVASVNPSLPYEGEAHGVRFSCTPADYAAGKMTLCLQSLTDTGGFKGAAARLCDALNGRWSHRCHGYQLAPSRAVLWRALFVAGWDAGVDWRGGHYGTSEGPKLESPDGRKVTLKEATAEIAAANLGGTQAESASDPAPAQH